MAELEYDPALLRPRKGSNATAPPDSSNARRRKRVQRERSFADANKAEVAQVKTKFGVGVLECPPFALEDNNDWMAYLRRNGFVVIKNVLPHEVAAESLSHSNAFFSAECSNGRT